jgi:uncharacterized protein YbaA (DUF1428 family)
MHKSIKKKSTTKYVDGFVLVVPKRKVIIYRKMARDAGKIWMKLGALAYKECVGDDLMPDLQGYPFLPFPKMAKLKPSETVWFSYIEYKSKTHRNVVNKRVMKEMEKQHKNDPAHMDKMPFDMKRFAYGGFKVIVDA